MTIGKNEDETEEEESEIQVRVNILEMPEKSSKYWVEFIKENGDRFQFGEAYKNIRDFFGGLVNAKE